MQKHRSKNGGINKRWHCLILLMLLCAGAFLRLWNLNVPSFWVDEVNSMYAAESWIENGDFLLPSGWSYDRAPLLTYATGLVFKFMGVSESTTRLPSAIFGLLSILMAYQLGKKIFNQKVGLLTAFMMAFSHFEVGWSRTARMYTLLQFLTLIFIYIFIRGFERKQVGYPYDQWTMGRSIFHRLSDFCQRWGLSPLWLIAGCGVFIISCFYVHYLTLFLLGGLFFYLLSMAVSIGVTGEGRERFLNKYTLVALLAVIAGGVFWFEFPAFRQEMSYFLAYTPPWAEGASSAQNKMFLFEFLIAFERFPLAAFFFVGCVQIFTRKRILGWIALWMLFCPLFFLSFVFTHRVPTYLLYVYPFFLMVASFGFMNLVANECFVLGKEYLVSKRWMRTGVLILFLSVFFFSPWLRITLHIPFSQDGVTNLAVTPMEWREASKIALNEKNEGDLIITSLPQVALYYGLKSDYTLNWSSLRQAKEKDSVTEKATWIDVYAGIPCIASINELQRIIQHSPRGWIIISDYNLNHINYTPHDMRDFIVDYFSQPMETKNRTVLIYRWTRDDQEDDEL